jgi:hypothetical protein
MSKEQLNKNQGTSDIAKKATAGALSANLFEADANKGLGNIGHAKRKEETILSVYH